MAAQPKALITVRGMATRVDRFDLNEPDESGVIREAARVQVLTSGSDGIPGGYAEMFFGTDLLAALPVELPAQGAWECEAGVFNRRYGNEGKSFPQLSLTFVRSV